MLSNGCKAQSLDQVQGSYPAAVPIACSIGVLTLETQHDHSFDAPIYNELEIVKYGYPHRRSGRRLLDRLTSDTDNRAFGA